jgi:hypothetical protein
MTQLSRAASGFGRHEFGESGFGRAGFALTAAFALHVLDEATTGFLHVYNPTVTAMRARWGWFPMPTFEFRQWLVGLSVAVVFCFALTPVATHGPRWLRPLAWFYAILMFLNGMGHTVFTILGRTGPFGDILAPGAGVLLVAIAIRGLCWANDAAPPDRIRIPACFPRLGTNASPRTIGNAGPDVVPILCYDR